MPTANRLNSKGAGMNEEISPAVKAIDGKVVAVDGQVDGNEKACDAAADAAKLEDSPESSEPSCSNTPAPSSGTSVVSEGHSEKPDDGNGGLDKARTCTEGMDKTAAACIDHNAVVTGTVVAEHNGADIEVVAVAINGTRASVVEVAGPIEADESAKSIANPESALENLPPRTVDAPMTNSAPVHNVKANGTGETSNAAANNAATTIDMSYKNRSITVQASRSTSDSAPALERQGANTNTFGLHSSKYAGLHGQRWNTEVNRPLRNNPPAQQTRMAYHMNGNELARAEAHIQHLENALTREKQKHAATRQTTADELRKDLLAGISTMCTDLVARTSMVMGAEAKLLSQKTKLHHREQVIQQHEVFLAEGQKMLMADIEATGAESWSALHHEFIRRTANVNARESLAQDKLELEHRSMMLKARENAVKLREDATLAMFRAEWEKELMENPSGELKKLMDAEFERGWALARSALDGDEGGRAAIAAHERDKIYWQGYQDCQAQQAKLAMELRGRKGGRGRHGRVASSSSEEVTGVKRGRRQQDPVQQATNGAYVNNSEAVNSANGINGINGGGVSANTATAPTSTLAPVDVVEGNLIDLD